MNLETQPLQWNVQQNSESVMVQLFGALTRHTLLPLWQQRLDLLAVKPRQHIYWDLQGLTQIDSAGFTLFAQLLNHYQKSNSNCIINTPKIIRNLAELFDLDEWFRPFLYCENQLWNPNKLSRD